MFISYFSMLYINVIYLLCKIHWTKCTFMWSSVNIFFVILLCSLVSEYFATFCTRISVILKVWELKKVTNFALKYWGDCGSLAEGQGMWWEENVGSICLGLQELQMEKSFKSWDQDFIWDLKNVKETNRNKSSNKNILDCLSHLQGFKIFSIPNMNTSMIKRLYLICCWLRNGRYPNEEQRDPLHVWWSYNWRVKEPKDNGVPISRRFTFLINNNSCHKHCHCKKYSKEWFKLCQYYFVVSISLFVTPTCLKKSMLWLLVCYLPPLFC